MILEFSYLKFFRSKNDSHFLLDKAELSVKLTFRDNSTIVIKGVKSKSFKGFTVDIPPTIIPDDPLNSSGGSVTKKIISQIDFTYAASITENGKTFQILVIKQTLITKPGDHNSNTVVDYELERGWWTDAAGKHQLLNFATHPLLNMDDLIKNKIYINGLITDLTDLWDHLHKDNVNYRIYKELSRTDRVTFKVFGNLSGNAFIWYSIVPKHVEKSKYISPHVFFSPSDIGEHQNIKDDKKYLSSKNEHFKIDGDTLFDYLLPPVNDADIPKLKLSLSEEFLNTKRNVLHFSVADDKKTITPEHWEIGAGLEKAFYGLDRNPEQILMMPQDFGPPDKGSSMKGVQTLGDPKALKQITDTILDVLLTNTVLIGSGKERAIVKDKMVLSCYSESGFDLWIIGNREPQNIKAVIAIEPQNLNKLENSYKLNPPIGKDVIPKLLKNDVIVFIIGRHDTPKYKPAVNDLKKLKLLPADPAKIFHYPPDPKSNKFVRYRVEKIMDISKDPAATPDDKAVIKELAARKPPVTNGDDILKEVFGKLSNLDCSCGGPKCLCQQKGVETWYSHHFALTGGEIMTLPDKGSIYHQTITYATFFQDAVRRIG